MKRLTKIVKLFLYFLKKIKYTWQFGSNVQCSNVHFGKNFYFDIKATDYKVKFNKNIHFRNNSTICIRNTGKLEIGENVFFNNAISINCHSQITIGKDCLFGENIKLYDHNHKFRDKKTPIRTQGFSYGEIKIGDNCWIGSNVVILKNVQIGDNVIIGANCVVTQNIPSNTIVKTSNMLEYIVY